MPVAAGRTAGGSSAESLGAVAGLVALRAEEEEGGQPVVDDGPLGAKGLEFVPIVPENLRELRSLNSVLFPMSYQDRYYREVLAYDSLSRLGTPQSSSPVSLPRLTLCRPTLNSLL